MNFSGSNPWGLLHIGIESVAGAKDGEDEFRLGGIGFDFFTQVFDVDIDGALVAIVGEALRPLQQFHAAEGAAGAGDPGGEYPD